MRCVHCWKCECGTRLKVISDSSPDPSVHENAACPTCGATTPIDGHILQVQTEDELKTWTARES